MEGLKGMTVEQLLDIDEFREELQVQITNECENHDKLAREAFVKGLRLQRAPIARLREREVFNVKDIVEIYKRIICKTLRGFSAAEREYVKNVCMMAYWRTVERLKNKEKQSQ